MGKNKYKNRRLNKKQKCTGFTLDDYYNLQYFFGGSHPNDSWNKILATPSPQSRCLIDKESKETFEFYLDGVLYV